jgi:Ca2+:H+ antiporter
MKERVPRSLWQKFPLQTGHFAMDVLLLMVPVALIVHFAMPGAAVAQFCASALAILPLAAVLGKATEDLSLHVGERAGGLMNATLGNATELIIAFFALRAGHEAVVKASLSGSIIGNVLLVLGASALVGGIGREKQTFSRKHMSVQVAMLLMCVVALVIPAVFGFSVYGQIREHSASIEKLSLGTSIVLIAIYIFGLIFTFRDRQVHEAHGAAAELHPAWESIVSLLLATGLIAWLSEILVGQLESAKHALGLSDVFLGVVVIATIGNAAEHATAIFVAKRDKMELAVAITAGSSSQIALFVAPVLVFASWMMGDPLSLVFGPLEIAGIALSVAVLHVIATDGETNWFEGAAMIAVYLILALAFFYIP